MAGVRRPQVSLVADDRSFPCHCLSVPGCWGPDSAHPGPSSPVSPGGLSPDPPGAYDQTCPTGRRCVVCQEKASGMYFGALVCLPCKSFFIRSTKDGLPRFTCLLTGMCDVTHGNRLRCQCCRFQKCMSVGMCRKEKPEIVEPSEGQVLCRVCHDIANGVHFGVPTCEGCKKFFRRALKESTSYFCKFEKVCTMNPRNRNSCRYCRYNTCVRVGMSRNAIRMGRPKKTGAKDQQHPERLRLYPDSLSAGRFPAADRADGADSSYSSCSPPPFTSSAPTVIRVHGYPPPADRAGTHVTSLTGGELVHLRADFPNGQSVIRSCGNPVPQCPFPVAEPALTRDCFRQTVLAHAGPRSASATASTSASLRPTYPNYYPSLPSTSPSTGGYSSHACCVEPEQGPARPGSLSSSPHSDMSSFGSTGEGRSALVDIEDDLADILSTLSQYNPVPPSANPGFAHCTTGCLDDLAGSGLTNQPSPQPIMFRVPKEEDDFRSPCQFGAGSRPELHPMNVSPAERGHSPATLMLPVKQEVDCNPGDPSTPEPGACPHGLHSPHSPGLVHPAQAPEKPDWSSPPPSLFSQLYNSLLLTYNVGGFGDAAVEDGRPGQHLVGHHGPYTALGSHGPGPGALTPLYT